MPMPNRCTLLFATLVGTPAVASSLGVTIEIPRLDVAEYHRPYVAAWIEGAGRSVATNLFVWYDLELKNAEGEKWLKDMRQWWRRSGRNLEMPIDGVSSATRPPGRHRLDFDGAAAQLRELPAGEYRLVIEAAREVGGREVLDIGFQWPPQSAQQLRAQGKDELGEIVVELAP